MAAPSAYARVLRYFPRYRGRLVGGVACVLGSRLLMVYAPLLLREALTLLEKGGESEAVEAGVTSAAWAFLGVSAAAGLLTWGQRMLLVGTSRLVERDLKRDLFAHVERLPITFFERTRSGDLLSRLTSDVEAVRFVVGPGPMYVAGTAILFPLALLVMLKISVPTTLLALGPLFAIAIVVRLTAPGIMRRSRTVQDGIGNLSARAQESFAGARVVRAYATEGVEVAAFETVNRALVRETLGLARQRAVLTGLIYGLGGLAQLAVLVVGGNLVIDGELGFGDLGAFLAYVGILIWPMISVGWVVSALQRAAAAIQRIDEVMRQPTEESVRTPPAVSKEHVDGALRVEALTFTHPGADSPALVDVSLSIPAGGTLALVGPVGSGKSTLLSLFTRTYEPPGGTVFVDDVDVTRIPLDQLRAAFAVVPQDPFLFSDSILGNLRYGAAEELTRERAVAAAAMAGLETDLDAFPRGMDTIVGERGMTLSGGQKQRTTLARALLRRTPVLMLDDALSSVDTHTEARILDRIEDEVRRRTVVIVAHRLSTVRHADHIVVVEAGRVTEAGSHNELLTKKGWYARTYANQRLEAELEDAP